MDKDSKDHVEHKRFKLIVLSAVVALTVSIHYGWVLHHLFGHHDWVHALHTRFCYIPIVIGGVWFGLRGGLLTAAMISFLIVPNLFGVGSQMVELSQELVEIFFYLAIGALVGFLIDRDERIRRQHALTERQLERSHQLSLVGQMAAGVAHEIKNPLASIKGSVEILCDPSTSAKDRSEFAEIVGREIKRVDGTVREFLEFARPREPELSRLDFGNSVSGSVRQLERQLAERKIAVRARIEPGLFVSGDGEKLHQAMLNLLLNSAEASPTGSSISVSVARSGRRVELNVIDEGKGISPEEIDKVFDPFFTTKPSGTGLGLAIVKRIIEAHNGSISIASEPGHGTRVTITLPQAEG